MGDHERINEDATNVWVRHGVLVAALSSSPTKRAGNRLFPVARAIGRHLNYGARAQSGGSSSVVRGANCRSSSKRKGAGREDALDGDDSDDGECMHRNGSMSARWGWVKASLLSMSEDTAASSARTVDRLPPAPPPWKRTARSSVPPPPAAAISSCSSSSSSSSSSSTASSPRTSPTNAARGVEADVTILVTDEESEYDGRTVVISQSLLLAAAAAASPAGPSSAASCSPGGLPVGGGIVMANGWTDFAAGGSSRKEMRTSSSPKSAAREEVVLDVPPPDLIQLTHLHEPAVVYCLRRRYRADEIYTSTGPILLALNPFKACQGLYGPDVMKVYWGRGEALAEGRLATNEETDGVARQSNNNPTQPRLRHETAQQEDDDQLAPHVYGVADAAYRAMMRAMEDEASRSPPSTPSNSAAATGVKRVEERDQSILVSGESGAGKTVTTKFIMQYLAALSKRSTAAAEAVASQPVIRAAPVKLAANSDFAKARKGGGGKLSAGSAWQPHFGIKVEIPHTPSAPETPTPRTPTTPRDFPATFSASGERNTIEQLVLQSNPILESFGNARTLRNDNSSRFGKFIEIKFTPRGALAGASIETYLLEKVRLVTQGDGERNYHIFYELLAGAPTEQLRKLLLVAGDGRTSLTPSDFAMTTSVSDTYGRRDGVRDSETFRDLRTAMDTMGFDHSDQFDVLKIVAGLLHLSNVSFVEKTREECVLDVRDESHSLASCLKHFGVTADALNDALCCVHIEAAGEKLVKTLGIAQSTKAQEAFIKATYGALFEYLVRRVNNCISVADSSDHDFEKGAGQEKGGVSEARKGAAAFIGVLDIFGFESFETNSFEQLCINFCNESLQQQFNRFVFKLEQEEYEREGISWKFIEFPDNQHVLDLIDRRHTGILSILDEQCMLASCTDKTFVNSVYEKCAKTSVDPVNGRKGLTASPSSAFAATTHQKAAGRFCIHHYAGPVEYDTTGFLEKNKDEIPKEMLELLMGSQNKFLRHLGEITTPETDAKEVGLATPGRSHAFLARQSSLVRVSVGGQFCSQLHKLRDRINGTAPHYIRCLKPNDDLKPDHFDSAVIGDQLRCAGILEAVRVSRVGFPQRYPHARFVDRYQVLAMKEIQKRRKNSASPSSLGRVGHFGGGSRLRRRPAANTADGNDAAAIARSECKLLVGVLAKKISQGGVLDFSPSTPVAATVVDDDDSESRLPEWANLARAKAKKFETATCNPSLKVKTNPTENGNQSRQSLDPTELGIQMGKTKVFLRQNAFDTLERMRSRIKAVAATMINSMVRMFLARIAYIAVRDAYREEKGILPAFAAPVDAARSRSFDLRRPKKPEPLADAGELIRKFEVETQRNPGTQWRTVRQFKWLLVDGRWARNQDYEE